MDDSVLAKIYLGSELRFEIVRGPGDSITLRNAQDPAEACQIPAELILIVAESLMTIRKQLLTSNAPS